MYKIHIAFNGTSVRVINEFSSRAKANKWMDESACLCPRGHVFMVEDTKNELVYDYVQAQRCIIPMGWRSPARWEDRPGRAATNLTYYTPPASHAPRG